MESLGAMTFGGKRGTCIFISVAQLQVLVMGESGEDSQVGPSMLQRGTSEQACVSLVRAAAD